MKYTISVIALVLTVYIMFLHEMVLKNPNYEAMDEAMAIGYLQNPQAEIWENYFHEDPNAFAYTNKQFRPHWFVQASPFLMALYYPFVKLLGINVFTVAIFSNFFALLAIGLTFFMAYKMFDKWTALLSAFFLISSLSFLIHVKAGVHQHMPSVCLMIGIAYLLWKYNQELSPINLALIGVLLSCAYMTGWITFPFASIMIALSFLFYGRKDIPMVVISSIIVGTVFILFTISFTSFYCAFTHFNWFDLNHNLFLGYLGRYLEGSVPVATDKLTFLQKLWYCIDATFHNMAGYDHPDKYLKGYPAIPYIFSAFFVIGLFFRNLPGVFYAWLISTYGMFLVLYLYSGRYALLALPCMAMIAAVGTLFVINLCPSKKLSNIAFYSALAVSIAATHYQYYEIFTNEKPFDFECDRVRGHYEFSQWLKENTDPETTLVILGDHINVGPWPLMFHTFKHPYRFAVWSNYKDKKLLYDAPYETRVYVFSSTLLGKPPFNDWEDFLKTHPQAEPEFVYVYQRKPLFYAYIMKGKQ